jgi:D-glycero-D-manno-heptose 1,7-bisphosphate phosphatase
MPPGEKPQHVIESVFFDRDGVLNDAVVVDGVPHPPASIGELRVADGAREAVRLVHGVGFLAIAITNQPDVARGTATRESVDAINAAVAREVGLDAVFTCVHDDADECACRKPKPGLLHAAAAEYGIDLAASFLVGDRVKDVACGRTAGCTTILIDRGYAETPPQSGADIVVSSLEEAVKAILTRKSIAR